MIEETDNGPTGWNAMSGTSRLLAVLAAGAIALIATVALLAALKGLLPAHAGDASSGGVSQDAAVEAARPHVPPDATFVSATAGKFLDVNELPGIGPGAPVTPDQLVWAVKFESIATICGPSGYCFSPRPGFSIVILDFKTGEWLATEGISVP
jgi:hypothetical protein